MVRRAESAKVDFGKQRRFTLKVRNTLQGESGVWAVVPLEEKLSCDQRCAIAGGKACSKLGRDGRWLNLESGCVVGKKEGWRQEGKRREVGSPQKQVQ